MFEGHTHIICGYQVKPSLKKKDLSTYLQLGWLERLSSKKEVMDSNLGPIAALKFYFLLARSFPSDKYGPDSYSILLSLLLLLLEVLIETESAAVSCDVKRTKTVCRTVEQMNSFSLKSITWTCWHYETLRA